MFLLICVAEDQTQGLLEARWGYIVVSQTASDLVELELQMTVNLHVGSGIKLQSSGRVARTRNDRVISPG